MKPSPFCHSVYNNNGGVKGEAMRARLSGRRGAISLSLELLFVCIKTKARVSF
jgi:hypothetical protein